MPKLGYRICQSCSDKFPNVTYIDGKRIKCHARQYCLKCSPWKFHNTSRERNRKRLSQLKTIHGQLHKFCRGCNAWIPESGYYNHKGHLGTLCKLCNSRVSQANGAILKEQAIAYAGGKCKDCSGIFHQSVFDFHHLDTKQKDFNIMVNKSASLESIKPELDKCVLLCANCHRDRHYNSSNLNYSPKGNLLVNR
jgi:hypothetical protein